MEAWERRWGCVFMCLWLLVLNGFFAAAVVRDPTTRVRALAACVGGFGLAFLWGGAHVLKSGRFGWSRGGDDVGVTHRASNPPAYWGFVALLGTIALGMLAGAAVLMTHAARVGAWLAK